MPSSLVETSMDSFSVLQLQLFFWHLAPFIKVLLLDFYTFHRFFVRRAYQNSPTKRMADVVVPFEMISVLL